MADSSSDDRERTCSACGRTKPTTPEHWPSRLGRPTGQWCMDCAGAVAGTQDRFDQARSDVGEGIKTCTTCGEAKPLIPDFWYFRSNGKPHSSCKECRKADAKARYQANPAEAREKAYAARRARAEQLREYDRDYYWTHREIKLQQARDRRERHRDKIRTQDRARGRPAREENRRILHEWYSQGCTVCGLVFLPGGMQAHHRDPGEKDQAASQLLSARKGTLHQELAKCEPFCASHHFMLTQAMREDEEGLSYQQFLAVLRGHWRQTLMEALRSVGSERDAPSSLHAK